MDEKLHKKLHERREKGTFRSLSSSEGMIDFASNDYLGFARDGIGLSPISDTGSTGSRLISGNASLVEQVESELASFFDSEAALCFNSGYDANLAVFSSIPQRGDVVIYDESIHASVRDGIRLSHAKAYSFKHNNLADLRRLLEANSTSCTYLAVESLYSMQGDFCPLLELVKLAKEFGAYLIVDEAHSAGVFGANGRGFSHALHLHNDLFLRVVTFGKAYGAHGAAVLCSSDLRAYLINFARPFIYSTALPANAYDRMKRTVESPLLNKRRVCLQSNIAYFREKMSHFPLDSEQNSPIQYIRFGSMNRLKTIERRLRNQQIFVKGIYSPTVPEGLEGLRISLHSHNSTIEIDQLVTAISAENDTFENN